MCHIYISMSIVIFFLIIKFIWEITGFVKKCLAYIHMCGVCMCLCIHLCWGHRCLCRCRCLSGFSTCYTEAGSLTELGALHFGFPACSGVRLMQWGYTWATLLPDLFMWVLGSWCARRVLHPHSSPQPWFYEKRTTLNQLCTFLSPSQFFPCWGLSLLYAKPLTYTHSSSQIWF